MKYLLAMAIIGAAFLAIEHLLMEDNEEERTNSRYDNQDLLNEEEN